MLKLEETLKMIVQIFHFEDKKIGTKRHEYQGRFSLMVTVNVIVSF